MYTIFTFLWYKANFGMLLSVFSVTSANINYTMFSARKNAIELKTTLEAVVVPMFCNASIAATEDQKLKLDKLLKLWESKANYMAPETVNKMRQPVSSYQQFKADQVAKFTNEVAPLAQQTKSTYDGYQAQHQAFVCHAMQQIMELNQQVMEMQQKQVLEVQSQVSSQIQNYIMWRFIQILYG